MDQDDPFPEDFCLLPYNQPMSVQALLLAVEAA